MGVVASPSGANGAVADTARLFAAHRASLISFAGTIVRSYAEAEDVVQEAFIRLSARGTGGLRNPLGYIYRTVRNVALDRRRALKRRPEVQSQDPMIEGAPDSATATPEDAAIRRNQVQLVRAEFRSLPSRMQRAVAMHRADDVKLKETAARLGVSTAYAHLLVLKGVRRCRTRAGWD